MYYRLAVVCGLFNGAAGVFGFGGIALVSAVWFPAHQRVAATAFSAALNGIGVAIPFLLGELNNAVGLNIFYSEE